MRLFPTLAAALIATTMVAACNKSTSTDQPQSDQAIEQPADIPSASTSSETNAALNSTAPVSPAANAPAASASANDATREASAKSQNSAGTATERKTKRVATHHRKHHLRSIAKNHHKHKHNRQAARARVRATTEKVAVLDTPQSDEQMDRADFKRQMQWRVANIADGVSRYHNQASITDSLTRYSQKVEDVKVADALARRQLRNIDTVSNDQWPSFKSNFQSQISQLEHDYQGIKQASR